MTVSLSPFAGAGWQFFDNNGNPLSGGKLYTYSAGTQSLLATYTSISGATANTNPIILDSAGRVPNEIWLTVGRKYDFYLYDALDSSIGNWQYIDGYPIPSSYVYNSVAYYNSQGAFSSNANFTFNDVTNALGVTGALTAASFNSTSGTYTSAAAATTVTLTTVANVVDSTWLVTGCVSNQSDPTNYSCAGILTTQSGFAVYTGIKTAANLTLSVSGLNLQANQTSGYTQDIKWTLLKLA